MNVFEKKKALLKAIKDLDYELFICNEEIKATLNDLIKASPTKAMTAYDLSLKTGLPSSQIAERLWFNPKTKTQVERTYALVLPDGTVDHDHTITKKYEAYLYHADDDKAPSSSYEGPSYQSVFDEILKNLKA